MKSECFLIFARTQARRLFTGRGTEINSAALISAPNNITGKDKTKDIISDDLSLGYGISVPTIISANQRRNFL